MKSVLRSKNELQTILQPMERGQITLPKAIRDAAGITSDTWLRVKYLINGKIEVEVIDTDQPKSNSLVSHLMQLRRLRSPLWTDEDTAKLNASRAKSQQDIQTKKRSW